MRPLSDSELTGSPDYYPAQLLVPARQLQFYRMSRAAYRASPFLDHRIARPDNENRVLAFGRIRQCGDEVCERVAHYIFHNAFCSSTLLTRYLDALDGALVLREPHILYEVASVRRFEGTPMACPLQGIAWQELYRYVRFLLARRYEDRLPTIIKPTDGCNNLMQDLVSARESNRGLFLYSALEHFMVSVLRFTQRHEWVKVRAQELLLDVRHETGVMPVNPASLSVAQAGALVWLLHTERYIAAVQSDNEGAFRSLGSWQLAASPVDCLCALCEHFGLPCDRRMISDAVRMVDGSGVNAKAAHEAFDPERRRREHDEAREVFDGEIRRALEWVSQLYPARDVSRALPAALL